MRRKILSLIGIGLVASIASTMLVGCGNKAKESNSNATAEKPEKISWTVSTIIGDDDNQKALLDKFKEITGIELEVLRPAHNQFYEKLDTSFASGSPTDVVSIGGDMITKYASQGALKDVTTLFNNSKLKNEINKDIMKSVTIDNKLYGVPYENGGGPVTYVRRDWLDNLNLKVPTTYDEYISMLKAFKGMGTNIIPQTGSGLSAYNYLIDYYQDGRPSFTKKNGKWVDGMLEPELKAALVRMQSAYADGLIDKEIVTNKTSDARDKFYANRVGAFTYWAGTWADNLQKNLVTGPAGTSAKVEAIPALKTTKYVNRVPGINAISSTVSDDKASAIFKYFFEFIADGDVGSALFTDGVENVHYKLDNGIATRLTKPDGKAYAVAYSNPEMQLIPSKTVKHKYSDNMVRSLKALNDDMVMDEIIPLSKTLSKVNSEVVALREKTIADIVIKGVDATASLKAYEDEMKKLGLLTILDELNTK